MKLQYALAISALTLTQAAQAQNWITDTVYTESGYLKNIYYSLENGQAGITDADNWHIGFSTDRFSPSILTNSADQDVRLYVIATDTTLFGTDLSAALTDSMTAHPMSLYNSNTSWETGAFNQTSAAPYGWATYDMSTHWLGGRTVFGLITATDTFQVFISQKQTTPSASAPVYVFKIAQIDGSNAVTKTFDVSVSPYAGKYFAYYNITNDAFLDREPARESWDFLFSNYNDESVVFNDAQYKVFGVINNEGLAVARVDTVNTEFENLDYTTYTYDTLNNSIGRGWKSSGQNGVTMNDSVTYFIEVANGDVWQLVFTAHNAQSASIDPGMVAFKKRKVYEANPTAVRTVNSLLNMVTLAPNPAQGNYSHLLIDATKTVGNMQIAIVDLNGRVMYQTQANITTGLQQVSLPVSNLHAGMYLVRLQGNGVQHTQKLIIQ